MKPINMPLTMMRIGAVVRKWEGDPTNTFRKLSKDMARHHSYGALRYTKVIGYTLQEYLDIHDSFRSNYPGVYEYNVGIYKARRAHLLHYLNYPTEDFREISNSHIEKYLKFQFPLGYLSHYETDTTDGLLETAFKGMYNTNFVMGSRLV